MTRPLIERLGVGNGKMDNRDINPKDIRADFLDLIEKHGIEIIYDHRTSCCTNVPYPISYRAITPLANECENLLVPVCFSASHLGYASGRMEPVFMICGESAGIAAAQAIREEVSVQQINMTIYQKKLLDYGQRLEW